MQSQKLITHATTKSTNIRTLIFCVEMLFLVTLLHLNGFFSGHRIKGCFLNFVTLSSKRTQVSDDSVSSEEMIAVSRNVTGILTPRVVGRALSCETKNLQT